MKGKNPMKTIDLATPYVSFLLFVWMLAEAISAGIARNLNLSLADVCGAFGWLTAFFIQKRLKLERRRSA